MCPGKDKFFIYISVPVETLSRPAQHSRGCARVLTVLP